MLEAHRNPTGLNSSARELAECPLCKSRNIKKEKSFSVENIKNRWKEYFSIDIQSYFVAPKGELSLWQCQDCQLRTFSPHPLPAPAELYVKLASLNREAYFTPIKWEFNQALEDLGRCKNILEIGYGSGAFLRAAVSKGLSIHGIELAPESTANSSSRNLPTLPQSLDELSSMHSEKFDGICSFQVLEHVPEPILFLEQCYRLLTPGGLLALAVPNDESYIRNQDNLMNFPPHHLTRWNEKCFQWVADHFRLELIHSRNEPLAKDNSHDFLETWCQERPWASQLLPPFLRYQLGKLLGSTGAHSLIQGQGMYVVFRKKT